MKSIKYTISCVYILLLIHYPRKEHVLVVSLLTVRVGSLLLLLDCTIRPAVDSLSEEDRTKDTVNNTAALSLVFSPC